MSSSEFLNSNVKWVEKEGGKNQGSPVLALIPGGPGLSSGTLKGIEVLSRSFDLAFIDPPGTGGQEEITDATFDGIILSIETALKELNRPIILVGHSYGGIYAMELTLLQNLRISGLVLISTPARQETLDGLKVDYFKLMTPELRQAEKEWVDSPSLNSFRNWLSSYGSLYFRDETKQKGQKMLKNDLSSFRTFQCIRNGWKPGADYDDRVRALSIPKLMIAGEEDKLVLPEHQERDANILGFKFHKIPEASHFVMLDQPEALASIVEENFS